MAGYVLHSKKQFEKISSKQVARFEKYFELPPTERLLEDFICGFLRDKVVQGRMYVSQNNICFYSNASGWVTTVVIPLKDVTAVTPKTSSYALPSALQIETASVKYVFSSFTSRDHAFRMLTFCWKNARSPEPKSAEAILQMEENEFDVKAGETDGRLSPEIHADEKVSVSSFDLEAFESIMKDVGADSLPRPYKKDSSVRGHSPASGELDPAVSHVRTFQASDSESSQDSYGAKSADPPHSKVQRRLGDSMKQSTRKRALSSGAGSALSSALSGESSADRGGNVDDGVQANDVEKEADRKRISKSNADGRRHHHGGPGSRVASHGSLVELDDDMDSSDMISAEEYQSTVQDLDSSNPKEVEGRRKRGSKKTGRELPSEDEISADANAVVASALSVVQDDAVGRRVRRSSHSEHRRSITQQEFSQDRQLPRKDRSKSEVFDSSNKLPPLAPFPVTDEEPEAVPLPPDAAFPCGCKEHLPGARHSGTLKGTVLKAYEAVFGSNTTFTKRFMDKQGCYSEYTSTPWTHIEEGRGISKRIVSFNQLVKSGPFGSKLAHVKETQLLLSKSSGYASVETEARTENVPYSDSFFVVTRYCFWKDPSGVSRFCVTDKCVWLKSTWLKGTIEGQVTGKAKEHMVALFDTLDEYFADGIKHVSKTKKRRPVQAVDDTVSVPMEVQQADSPRPALVSPLETSISVQKVVTVSAVVILFVLLWFVVSTYFALNDATERLEYWEMRSLYVENQHRAGENSNWYVAHARATALARETIAAEAERLRDAVAAAQVSTATVADSIARARLDLRRVDSLARCVAVTLASSSPLGNMTLEEYCHSFSRPSSSNSGMLWHASNVFFVAMAGSAIVRMVFHFCKGMEQASPIESEEDLVVVDRAPAKDASLDIPGSGSPSLS